MIEILIKLLEVTDDKNVRAMILQSYIQEHGAIPDEYGDKVRSLLEKEE